MNDRERAVIEAARKVAKWWPVGCLQYRKDCEELDASLAALDAAKPEAKPDCGRCRGKGELKIYDPSPQGPPDWVLVGCADCNGTGKEPAR